MSRREFLVISMHRQGHHGVLNWTAHQLGIKLLHHNNCGLNFDKGFKEKTYYKCEQGDKVTGLIYSWEAFDLACWPKMTECHNRFEWVMIVIRDPFNFIASALKAPARPLDVPYKVRKSNEPWYPDCFGYTKSRLDMWKEYCEQVIGDTNFLRGERVIGVLFNSWVSDKSYRRHLAHQLGVDFTDKGINEVRRFAGGSSFDKLRLDGNAQRMQVNDRWRIMVNDQRWKSLVSYPGLAEWSERLFGFNPLAE